MSEKEINKENKSFHEVVQDTKDNFENNIAGEIKELEIKLKKRAEVNSVKQRTLEKTVNNEIIVGSSPITRKKKNFVIPNVILYGLNGEPVRVYSEVKFNEDFITYSHMAGSGVEERNQDSWTYYFEYFQKKNSFPSLPLLCAIAEVAYDNRGQNQVARALFQNLKRSLVKGQIMTSSRIDYSNKKIFHDYDTFQQITFAQTFPNGEQRDLNLQKLINNEAWEKSLKALFMAKDLKKVFEVLREFGRGRINLLLLESDRIGQSPIQLYAPDELKIIGDSTEFDKGRVKSAKAEIVYDKTNEVQ